MGVLGEASGFSQAGCIEPDSSQESRSGLEQPIRPKHVLSNEAEGAARSEEIETQGDVEVVEDDPEEAEEKEQEEGRAPMTRRDPAAPTRQEYEGHQVSHTPFRSWCKSCVAGRGKQNYHKKKPEEEDGNRVPNFHLDYWFMREKAEDVQNNTLIVITNQYNNTVSTCAVERKTKCRIGSCGS